MSTVALASDARGSEMPLRGAKASEMEAIASIVSASIGSAVPARRRSISDLCPTRSLFFQRCEEKA